MKKEYFSPELELIHLIFNNEMLTGSVENDRSYIGGNDDNGEEVEYG